MMEYIIDGYNLIKSTYLKRGERRSIEFARDLLGGILANYKRKHPSVNFTVVFDGRTISPADFRRQEIKVLFSGDITADEKIRRILESKKKGIHEIIVVSDDREIQTGTKILGGSVCRTAEFLEKISPVPGKRKENKNPDKNLNYKSILTIEKELKNYYERKIGKS